MQNLKQRRHGSDSSDYQYSDGALHSPPLLKSSSVLGRKHIRMGILGSILGVPFIVLVFLQEKSLPISLHTYNQLPEVARVTHVLVSYSYFEKDEVQKQNLEFFLSVGMGLNSKFMAPNNTDLTIVINGQECFPCINLLPIVQQVDPVTDDVSTAWQGEFITMLKRKENEGMDFAAHNTTIAWLQRIDRLKKYAYFIFLNSSVRGPFVPLYMPPDWSWTRAYTDLFTESVGVVSSSLVCLPTLDAGGYGPKVESWAFALLPETLELLVGAGVFNVRTCKLCDEGVVVQGEYGISNVLMAHGWNLNTLMYKYRNVNWLDQKHWTCNSNVHPSRHGTYDGITMHPMEVVFIKASWNVGEPFTSKYSEWLLAQSEGQATTQGEFNEGMYRYAISMEAQQDRGVHQCYKVIG